MDLLLVSGAMPGRIQRRPKLLQTFYSPRARPINEKRRREGRYCGSRPRATGGARPRRPSSPRTRATLVQVPRPPTPRPRLDLTCPSCTGRAPDKADKDPSLTFVTRFVMLPARRICAKDGAEGARPRTPAAGDSAALGSA